MLDLVGQQARSWCRAASIRDRTRVELGAPRDDALAVMGSARPSARADHRR